jgi:hypothetical protein
MVVRAEQARLMSLPKAAVTMDPPEAARTLLMYFILPLWLAAGFADYLCHRATHIERTSGWKESVLHLLQFAEMGVPVCAALFLDINAAVILVMIICFFLHELTAMWDLRYANATRGVPPVEQHVHSFLEMLPLMGLLLVTTLHWDQFASLFGSGEPRFEFALKPEPLPWLYVMVMLALTLLFEALPLTEELVRGISYRAEQARPE